MSNPQEHRWDVDQIVAYRLSPYPPFDLPPLPPITDPALEQVIHSYVSTELGPFKFDKDLFVMDGPVQKSFEELHTVGFALLEAIATTWAHERYPHFRQGEADLLRSNMIRKSSLSQLTVRYNLHTMINFDPNVSVWTEVDIGRIQAEVFEAYIGAVYYSLLGPFQLDCSHPTTNNGPKSEEEVDVHKNTTTSSKEQQIGISSNVPTRMKEWIGPLSRGQAFDRLYSFLSAFLDRVWENELDEQRKKISSSHIRPTKEEIKRFPIPSEWEREDEKAKGSKTLLDITATREGPVYTYGQIGGAWSDQPWRARCRVVDVDGREWTSEAIRMTKKKAENMAAWKICVEVGLIAEDD